MVVAATIWFLAFIGLRPLANPDEGRYTEIPREMAVSGDYVTPRLNGVKYFEKPPLVYWLSALTFKAFGVSHFTARLWVALFAVAGTVLTYCFAFRIYGRAAGLWSAIVLATTIIYYVLAQIILLDMAVSVMISGALFSFLLGVRESPGAKRRGLFTAHYVFMALATLCKGLIGFLIPGAVMFLWLLMLGKWRSLRPFYPFSGIVIFLAIALPWHVQAALANHSAQHSQDFLWFYFVHEHFERFTTTVHRRYEPWWWFLPFLVGGLFPWIVFGWQSVARSLRGGWKARHEHADAWFLVIWIVFIVVFFSASQSKLIPYILPVIPACAVLIGRYVAERRATPLETGFGRGAWAFIALAVGLGLALPFVPRSAGLEGLTQRFPFALGLFSAILLGGAAFTAFALRKRQPQRVIAGMAATVAVLFAAAASMGGAIEGSSTLALSRILQKTLKPEDRVFHVGLYAQDMPAYLARQVDVAGYEGELEFGIESEPDKTAGRFIPRDRFVAEWQGPQTTYAVMRTWYYDKWFSQLGIAHEVVGRSGDLCLLVNRVLPPPP